MGKASDNPFPSVLAVEQGSTPASPSASRQRLFIRASDHTLCMVDSSGNVTVVGGGPPGAASTAAAKKYAFDNFR